MIPEGEFSPVKIIDCMAVIDIDPTLTHFRPAQQKWISSIQLHSDLPKDIKPSSKVLNLLFGLYLVVNFCEKNRLPIFEIDFISQPGPQWIPIKMPHNFADRFIDIFLCYKTQQIQLAEPLGDIDVINIERKSVFGHDKQVLNVPNGYKVVSNPIFQSFLIYKRMKSRLQQTFKPVILESYPEGHSTNLDLIPSFCFPEGIKLSRQLKGFITFSFILTQSSGDRLYITFLTFKQLLYDHLKNKLDVKGLENIYYDKGICVISKFKFSEQLSDSLQHLYRLSMSKNDQPFYKVAQNFVNQLKMPKQISTHGFSYSYSGCNIMFDYDPVLQTVSDKSLFCVFKFMPVEQILTVFKAILYERQIIFVSQSKTVLGMALEAFTSLLFPFKWQNVIIPIVPFTMKEYLTAPIPFLAGVTTAQLIDMSIESEVVIVLLDSGKVMNDEDLPPLPQKMHKQLSKRIQQFQIYDPDEVKEYLQNPQNTYMFKMMEVEHPEFKGILIREAFFQFFLTLMKNYKKFWKSKFFKDFKDTFSIKSNESQLISQIFKLQDFMSDLGINKVGSFGHKFTQSAIFTTFLERRHFDAGDGIANFFDECLEKKKNKKFEGPLLIRQQKARYIVSKHPEPEKQKNYYSYERFPSILAEPSSKQLLQQQITLQVEQEELLSQAEFLQFIEEQLQLNKGYYQSAVLQDYKSQFSQFNLSLLNLLTNKNKQLYLERLKDLTKSNKKYFQVFKEIYEAQSSQIQKMLKNWPKFSKGRLELVRLDKISYLNMKLQKKIGGQGWQKILSVWQENNLEIVKKGSIKIILVTSYNQTSGSTSRSQIKPTSLSSSTIGKALQTVYVYVPDYRIKSFLNKQFESQAEQIFQFIHNKVKNGSDNVWNIQTIIELREYIEKQWRQDQLRQDKFTTANTLELESKRHS